MITATDLCLTLDGRVVLDHVSFHIARGESVALVGPNGSGKTSILRCLLGLVPFAGQASIGGHDVVSAEIAARSLVSYVPQKAAFGDAPAREVLGFVARLRRIDRARIVATLREVGLEAHANERVRTFSGGMQQRLSLALALLADTPVLLLDEPSASLDHEGQEHFFEIVGRLRHSGRTLLLASHRPEEVDSLTNRVLHIDRGRLVSFAAPAEKLARVIPFSGTVDQREERASRASARAVSEFISFKTKENSARPEKAPSPRGRLEGPARHLSTIPSARGERR